MRKARCKRCTNKECRFNATIGNFDMNSVILDLGSDVNILPKKTWEQMGKPKMVWSPIKIWLVNPHKIYPIGILEDVEVDIDGVKSRAKFEVIKIIDDMGFYLGLLAIDWAFDNLSILNLKKRKMSFQSKDIRVVVPWDLEKGDGYVEPMREDLEYLDLENF